MAVFHDNDGNFGVPVGYFYLTGVAADEEILTLGNIVHEFDDDATYTAGRVQVDISGDATADASITALVAAANAAAARKFDLVAMAGNSDTTAGCAILGKYKSMANQTISTDVTNGVVSAATSTGAKTTPAAPTLWTGTYTATAADVTMWARTGSNEVPIAGITTTGTPKIIHVSLSDANGVLASEATVAAKLTQANGNFYALLIEDGGAVISATDVLSYVVTL